MKIYKNYLKQSKIFLFFIRRLRLLIIRHSRPVVSAHGFYFIGHHNMISGEFEKNEFEQFSKEILSSDLFVNVGANFGYYVSAALHLNKKVIAFEPDKYNFSVLKKNVELSLNPNKCLLLNLGVGSSWQVLKIYHAATGSSFHSGWANNSKHFFNEIQIVTLDDFALNVHQNILFLVDVEGFEADVIFGSKHTIQSVINQTWMVEIMTDSEYLKDKSISDKQLSMLSLFEKSDFEVYYLVENRLHEISYELLKDSIINNNSNFGHNFIFKKNKKIRKGV